MLLNWYLKVKDVLFNEVVLVQSNDRPANSVEVCVAECIFVPGGRVWRLYMYVATSAKVSHIRRVTQESASNFQSTSNRHHMIGFA